MILNSFFLKRDLILGLIIIILGIGFSVAYLFVDYPKINQNKINQYEEKYLNALKKKQRLEKELKKREEILNSFKPYIFTKDEILKTKKVLDYFNSILNKLKVTDCRVTDYAFSEKFINVVRYRLYCRTDLDAKKYKILFKYFFVDKTHIFNVLNILNQHNIVFIDFIKKVK